MAKILKVSAGLLLVLIASYLGAHYWLRWKNTVRDDVTKVGRLVECEPNQVRAITIERGHDQSVEKLSFERVDQAAPGVPPAVAFSQADWRYRAPLTGEAEATLLRRLASTVCEFWDPVLVREGEVVASGNKLMFALDTGARIELELGSVGTDRLLPVRIKDPSGAVKGAKVPDLIFQVASRPAAEYRSKRVMRMEADNVQQATLKIDGKERFTLERAGAEWTVLTAGKKLGAAAEAAGRFVNRIASLQAIDVLEPEYGQKDCLNLKAKAELALRGVAGREETVVFDYGRGGDIAACSTARSMKFRVHRDLVRYLDVNPKSMLAN